MSTGQFIFFSGVGLLVLTVVLGIIFWVKKPRYIPGNESYDGSADKNTRKLRSGYPTDRLTIHREAVKNTPGTAVLQESVEQFGSDRDEPLPSTAVLLKTAVLEGDITMTPAGKTELLMDETAPLSNETVPLESGKDTEQLFPTPMPYADGTEKLELPEQAHEEHESGGTEILSGPTGGSV